MAQPEPQPNPYRRSLLRQERSRQTREALVRAALALWREHGFDDTTIDDISSAAGVARSTYYFHFPDKEVLLREVAGMSAESIGDAVARAMADTTSLEEGLRVFAFELASHVQRLPRDLVGQVTLSVIGGISGLGNNRTAGRGFDHQLEAIFDHASDELTPGTDNVELGAIAAGMVMEGILRWSSGATGSRSLEDVISERMALIVHGVRRTT
jgi:AcrR family transcriptional regulator